MRKLGIARSAIPNPPRTPFPSPSPPVPSQSPPRRSLKCTESIANLCRNRRPVFLLAVPDRQSPVLRGFGAISARPGPADRHTLVRLGKSAPPGSDSECTGIHRMGYGENMCLNIYMCLKRYVGLEHYYVMRRRILQYADTAYSPYTAYFNTRTPHTTVYTAYTGILRDHLRA